LHLESEVDEVREQIEEAAGKRKRRTGQGFRVSPELRKKIEDYAMKKAQEHYISHGWTVQDVSKPESYDLHCVKGNQELRVEVKGTTSDGREVLLTPNEVSHAREAYPQVALSSTWPTVAFFVLFFRAILVVQNAVSTMSPSRTLGVLPALSSLRIRSNTPAT
jgi:hypothetical protein